MTDIEAGPALNPDATHHDLVREGWRKQMDGRAGYQIAGCQWCGAIGPDYCERQRCEWYPPPSASTDPSRSADV
jgi:hypothetical protein